MNRTERALAQFATDSACSQSVAIAFSDVIGLEETVVHRLNTGFGGGIAGRQMACGAVLGGVLVLSARHGSDGPEQADRKAATKEIVAAYLNAVEKRLDSLTCRGILGVDMDEARRRDLFSTVCRDAVRVCTEEVEKRL
jgi:C_GCAxxG_C_C family probable redox protein